MPGPHIRRLGRRPYPEVWEAMRAFTHTRTAQTADEIWVLEHLPVFTLGQNGKMEHVIEPGDIPLIKVDRGGQVTYHGPGQLVVYVLLDLRRTGIGIRALVTLLEESVIGLLGERGVEAYARGDAPGVYVQGSKIASIGLRVTKGCCYHGLSLNVDMDLAPFERIHPCGWRGLHVTQMSAWCGPTALGDASGALLDQLCRRLPAVREHA